MDSVVSNEQESKDFTAEAPETHGEQDTTSTSMNGFNRVLKYLSNYQVPGTMPGIQQKQHKKS